MNAAQAAFAASWTGPMDESYFDGLAALDPVMGRLSVVPEPEPVPWGGDAVIGRRAEPLPVAPTNRPPQRTLPASIGRRTARDLSYGPAEPQLVRDTFMAPRGASMVYGKGGVGKGILTAWLGGELVRQGHVVMLLDFEGHEDEWGQRWRGLGLTDGELDRIAYRTLADPEWTARKGALAQIWEPVAADCLARGVTALLVDSFTTATTTGDAMGGQAAAQEYFGALARLALPSWTIAHVPGAAERFPSRPFGSVFVHNLARETWAVERYGADEPEDDEEPYAPAVVQLELRNMKRNTGRRFAPQFVTFGFNGDGSIDVATDVPADARLTDVLVRILAAEPAGHDTRWLVRAYREDTSQTISEDTARLTMKRHPRRFRVDTTSRPHLWSAR